MDPNVLAAIARGVPFNALQDFQSGLDQGRKRAEQMRVRDAMIQAGNALQGGQYPQAANALTQGGESGNAISLMKYTDPRLSQGDLSKNTITYWGKDASGKAVLKLGQVGARGEFHEVPVPGEVAQQLSQGNLGTTIQPFGRYSGFDIPAPTGAPPGNGGTGYTPYPSQAGTPAPQAGAPGGGGRPIDNAGKAYERQSGELGGKAAFDLPGIEARANTMLAQVERVRTHPGRDWATGTFMGRFPAVGGQQAGFVKNFETLQSQEFLQSYDVLRGAGQISDAEGKVGEKAMAALDRVETKEEFDQQLDVIKGIVEKALTNARARATLGQPAPQGGGAAPPPAGNAGLADLRANPPTPEEIHAFAQKNRMSDADAANLINEQLKQ